MKILKKYFSSILNRVFNEEIQKELILKAKLLSNQNLKLKDGKSLPLQTGMSLTANIKLRKVSYLRLLLSNFKSKTDSLKEI